MSRRENTSKPSIFYIHDRPKDSNDNSEYYPPLSPRFYEQHDIPYFTFTSQGEILSGPHRSAAGLLSPLNPMDPGVEMSSWNELSYTIDVLPECNGSFTSDILADFYAQLYGVHEGEVVQGHDRLTIHQLLEISYGRDMASRLNPSDVTANFIPLTPSYRRPLASVRRPFRQVGKAPLRIPLLNAKRTQWTLQTADKVTSPVLRASAPSSASSTNESVSHLWNVDQDSRNADRIMTDVPLSTSPVIRPNTWLPERALSSAPIHAFSVLPPFPISTAPDSQAPHIPANWPGRHGVGLLQPAPQHYSSSACRTGYSSILQEAPRPNFSIIRSGIHTPYSAHIALSSPNGSLPETNPHQTVCGWRLRDGSICGGPITKRTVPEHLAVHHGIKKIASYQLIACRWCPDGSDLIKRESIVRHVREVHLRLRRSATI
ncbi:hypothetical protein BU15DRAFT_78106 [Melanogaster broomeanus]|nr:hypothetical protein BU15DRAFT_78106 [Melanogaster broomeanus]